MAFSDWTLDERKEIIDILKDYPTSVRLSVRDRIKDMSAGDALETVKALLSSSEDVQGDNIAPSSEKPLKDVLSPSEIMQGDNIGDKSKEALKAVKSPSETEKNTRSRQTKSPGSSYKEKKSPAKPVKHPEAVKGSIKPLEAVKAPEKPLERVQGDIMTDTFNIDDIKARINAYIPSWCASHDIDDLRKAEQPIFNALCTDIGNVIFKPSAVLKSTKLVSSNSAAVRTNNNAYDIGHVIQSIDLYDYFCNVYGKVFTIWAAAAFCGVSKDFFYDNMEKLTRSGCDLHKNNERSLADSIVSGRRSPVGALAWLNRYHQWSGTGANRTEVRETTVMYPVLVDINKSTSEGLPDNSNK